MNVIAFTRTYHMEMNEKKKLIRLDQSNFVWVWKPVTEQIFEFHFGRTEMIWKWWLAAEKRMFYIYTDRIPYSFLYLFNSFNWSTDFEKLIVLAWHQLQFYWLKKERHRTFYELTSVRLTKANEKKQKRKWKRKKTLEKNIIPKRDICLQLANSRK